MSYLSRISIKSKLLIMLLGVSLTSVLIIGFLSLRTAERALEESIRSQLTSIRSIKSDQIVTYLGSISDFTAALGNNSGVVNDVADFTFAFQEGAEQSLTEEEHEVLTDYYLDEYLPLLAESMAETPLPVLYRPRTPAASYFQYHYIANNPYPFDQKSEMITAEDDVTTYKRIHEANHAGYRALRDKFGFDDLYLIDIESGVIVYSISKAPDFGTSLYTGPYRNSGLGQLAAQIRNNPEQGVLQGGDYRPYPPALNAPTGFLAMPLYRDSEAIGILAVQVPLGPIDDVMTSGGDWEEIGLGNTGEAYLVGGDQLMRSVSRFYLEDKEAYLESALASGLPQATVDSMRRHSTVLLQPVTTEASKRALAGESGTDIIRDYRGVEVLSSYAPVTLGRQPWAIIAEVDVVEAFAPILALQRTMLVWSVGLMVAVAFLAILLAQFFVRPIDKLTAAAKSIAAGNDGVHVDVTSDDEFGDLARNFNSMADSIHDQKSAIAAKSEENERLLLNILPASVAERLQAGERVADDLQQVSVIFIHMLGFSELSQNWTAVQSAEVLEQLIDMLDEASERYGVERVRTLGEMYIAACGLTTARLDHASQTVDFAIEALGISQRLDQEHAQQLSLQIGIHSGPVVSGVVGKTRFNYELWGETVEVAKRLYTTAKPNGLLITETVFQRIDNQLEFHQHGSVSSFNGKSLCTNTTGWMSIQLSPLMMMEAMHEFLRDAGFLLGHGHRHRRRRSHCGAHRSDRSPQACRSSVDIRLRIAPQCRLIAGGYLLRAAYAHGPDLHLATRALDRDGHVGLCDRRDHASDVCDLP